LFRAIKAVTTVYKTSQELALLFEDFRLMCNDAIRIALRFEKEHGRKVSTRFALIELAHPHLSVVQALGG